FREAEEQKKQRPPRSRRIAQQQTQAPANLSR
ncbi:MAG: hypothetical protein ACI88S_001098, partial [Ilumatobacter sp.]